MLHLTPLLLICALPGTDSAPATMTTPSTAPASQPAATQPASQPAPFLDVLHNERLTGDWGGVRPSLRDAGIDLTLSLTSVFQDNARGGLQTHHAHEMTGSYDLELTLDLGAMKLLPGGKLYALAEGSWDQGVGRFVGDRTGVNGDAAGDRAIDETELWYEQALFGDKLRWRTGKIDLTVDFDTNAFANDETIQFLNAALINTGNIPFPQRGLGTQVIAKPCEWLYAGAGVADAQADNRTTGFHSTFHGPDWFFSIYELGITPQFHTARGTLPGAYRIGLWYDPQPKARFYDDIGGRRTTQPMRRDDHGFYLNGDQLLFKERPDDAGDDQGLGAFARYGYAPGAVNEVKHFWSVGAQYKGLLPARDADVLAFGAAQDVLSRQLRKTGVDPHAETVLELYYNAKVLPWLTVTPDMQWVLDPGRTGGRDAFVFGVRLQAAF